jgi:hypothetical protein
VRGRAAAFTRPTAPLLDLDVSQVERLAAARMQLALALAAAGLTPRCCRLHDCCAVQGTRAAWTQTPSSVRVTV